jgi:hypothetical protein
MYRFDGTLAQIISDRNHDVSLATATPATVWDGRHFRVSAMVAASTNEHWYDTATSAQTPRGYSAGTWWPQSLKSGTVYAYSYAAPRQSIVYWGDDSGFIYFDYTASTDDSAEIIGDAYTGYWDCGDAGWQKRLVKILVDAKLSGTVTVAWDTDFSLQSGSFVLTSSPSTTGRTEHEVTGHVDFRRIRMRIYGTGASSFSLAAITLRIGRVRPD